MVVVVLFAVWLKTQQDDDVFRSAFKKLHDHVLHNEPGTLTYELHECFEEGKLIPFKYLVLERYCNSYDFNEVHLKSGAFDNFLKIFNTLDVAEKKLQTFQNDEIQDTLNAMTSSWKSDNSHPLMSKGVLVFCGSRHGKNPVYKEEAASLGMYIARKAQRPLIYGGGTVGIMGEVAQTVKKEGGHVIAVIPKPLCQREASGEMIGDLIYYTTNMSERKSIMFAHADTVVALPGGVGTFDELLEVITLFQLNAYRPKIGIINANGFFEPFLELLRHLVEEGFLEEDVFNFVLTANTAIDIMEALAKFHLPPSPANGLVWHARP